MRHTINNLEIQQQIIKSVQSLYRDFQNYLQLGPLELKLLNVKGHAMNIYKPATPADDELKAKDFKPDEWPVTAPMMLDSFR